MERWIDGRSIEVLIHGAAFIAAEGGRRPLRAIDVNIVGTANVVRLCMAHAIRLVYISTDYVFRGDRGQYREEDEVPRSTSTRGPSLVVSARFACTTKPSSSGPASARTNFRTRGRSPTSGRRGGR